MRQEARAEAKQSLASPVTRIQTIDTFNQVYSRWRIGMIGIAVKLLTREPLIEEEYEQLYDLRATTEGIRRAVPGKGDRISYYDYQGDGTSLMEFNQHTETDGQAIPTGVKYGVMEGIPVDGMQRFLIKKLAEVYTNTVSSTNEYSRNLWVDQAPDLEACFYVIEDQSQPYREMHPEVTSEEYKDRIRHETHLRKPERDEKTEWLSAEKALARRRELVLPGVSDRPTPVAPTMVPEVSSAKKPVVVIPEPVAAVPPVVAETLKTAPEVHPESLSNESGVGIPDHVLARRLKAMIEGLKTSGKAGYDSVAEGLRGLRVRERLDYLRIDPETAREIERQVKRPGCILAGAAIVALLAAAALLAKSCEGDNRIAIDPAATATAEAWITATAEAQRAVATITALAAQTEEQRRRVDLMATTTAIQRQLDVLTPTPLPVSTPTPTPKPTATPTPTPTPEPAIQPTVPAIETVTVVHKIEKGDTLYGITEKYLRQGIYGTAEKIPYEVLTVGMLIIADANNNPNPNLIRAGNVLNVNAGSLRTARFVYDTNPRVFDPAQNWNQPGMAEAAERYVRAIISRPKPRQDSPK